ncbi:phosphotriesterase family protein [Rummeliibacillus sp. JY-2-4R]
MSKLVNTVLGPVAASDLGKTLMHEHFFFGYPGFYGNTKYERSFEALIDEGVAVAERAKKHGVQTIVDATPSDCGRYPEALAEVSRQSGVNIICSTGYYYEGEGAPAYFKFKSSLGTAEEEIYELFTHEIKNGIGDTGIKPGVIKLGTSKDVITPYEETFIRVAARVQQEQDIPIITHTQEGTMGPQQAELLVSLGANPKKIVIGHMDGNTDMRYQLETLKHGVHVGFDRLGIQGFVGAPTDKERIMVLLGIIQNGYANQLTLSHDTVNVWLGKAAEFPPSMSELLKDWNIEHIFLNIIPQLKEYGVSDDILKQILIDNPKNIFNS